MTTKTVVRTQLTTLNEAAHDSTSFHPTTNLSSTKSLSSSRIISIASSSRFTDTPNLSGSLLQEYFVVRQGSKISETDIHRLGTTVLERSEQIYHQTQAIRNLVSNAKESPMRFGCSVITLATGIASIYAGDVITGGVATVIGAKEIYNQCSSGNNSTLHHLLNDINADVDMITTLEEGQQQSLKLVEENLYLIRNDVSNLYHRLDQIRNLNTATLDRIEEDKWQAYAKGIAAKLEFRKALEAFDQVKSSFSSSKEHYRKAADFFVRIQKIASDEDAQKPLVEKVNALVDEAKLANQFCFQGKKELDAAELSFAKAMETLSRASNLKDEALVEITKAVQNAENALKVGIEKAQYTEECKERIGTAQAELQEMKQRSDDIMDLLREMSNDVKKAKKESQKKLNFSDAAVGIGTGVFCSSLGAVSAFAFGVTAAYAWHNGSTIVDTTKKVYNFFFGEPLLPPQPMRKDELIRVELDAHSSGYYGKWVEGRTSYTYGHVDIQLSETEICQFRFDLNQAEYPISKEDLFTLYSRMFEKLKDGSMTPARCKSMLTQLERQTIPRGRLHPTAHGLIKPEQAAHGLVKALRRYCDKPSAL